MEEKKIKCPNCHASYYVERGTIATALAWTNIYRDGKLISTNPNTYTTSCKCMNCGQEFNVIKKGSETKIVPVNHSNEENNDIYS